MGMFEDIGNIGKGNFNTALLGLGVAIVAPAVLPTVTSMLRPLVKAVVKGGVAVYDAAREGIAEAGDEIDDLVAESRTEMRTGSRRPRSPVTRQAPDSASSRGSSTTARCG